jgi:small subunit ribosomal protein S17
MPQKKSPEEASNYDPTLPSSQRDYRLTTTDFYLKKALPHRIPQQYLQYSNSDLLHPIERAVRDEAKQQLTHSDLRGVVVSSGKMDRTVKVRVPGQTWNRKIQKVCLILQPSKTIESAC